MEEQKQIQTETITETKTSVGVVNVAVATLLMGASFIVASGIVMGLSNMRTMPAKKVVAISTVFMPKVIDSGHTSNVNFNGRLDVYNRGVFAGSLTDQWTPSGESGVNTLNPLSIEVYLPEGTTADVPAQAITLQTDGNVVTTLCYPGGKDVTSGDLKYYYDVYGTPYNDAVLTDPVMNTKCPSLLANSYNPMDLTSGDLNTPYPDAIGSYVRSYIVREGFSIGAYLGSEYGFDMNLWDGNYDLIGGKSPLLVSIGHFAEGTQTIPERVWTFESDLGVHELCIPSVTVQPYVGSFFLYDMNGRPYTDALLTRPVACGVDNSDPGYQIQDVTKDLDNTGDFTKTLPDRIAE
ncbi:MAG: hypothetical protein WC693_07015 [Patescibacteria group bacterium]|jgi:hypothetical protein